MGDRKRTIGAGVAGGMLGGALVGAAEAVAVWSTSTSGAGMPPIGWAVAAYGSVGGLGGLGAGVVAAALGTGGFGLALGAVAAGLGAAAIRFHVAGEVFGGRMPGGATPAVVQLVAVAALALLAFAVWRALRAVDPRRGLLTRPGVVAVLVGGVALVGSGFGAMSSSPAPSPAVPTSGAPVGAPNVILLVVDSLRADHLSCYAYRFSKTPSIDALAQAGTRYWSTFAQASWTRPSVATILSGLYPSSHGAIRKGDVLADRVETLPELLARNGYYTAGFTTSGDLAAPFGFAQGFAEYEYLAPERFFHADETAARLALYGALRFGRERVLARPAAVTFYYRPAEEVVGRALEWLDGPGAKRTPFFLYLHFMDPHEPYMAHPFGKGGYARAANPHPAPEMAEAFRKAYDAEITYVDANIGVLLADLARRGLYDRTLIVLTADHGEEFQDHGGWWHGTSLYDEQIRVPLLVKGPATGIAGRTVMELTTSLDIAPTILSAARVPVPATMQGHALPLYDEPAPPRESVFAEEDFEGSVLRAIRTPQRKLITANPANPRGLAPEELYDVETDPKEARNLAGEDPAGREELRAALGRRTLEAKAHAGGGPSGDGGGTEERLKALGYVE